MKRFLQLAILSVASTSLAACGSISKTIDETRLADQQNVDICPNAFALSDAARAIEFVGDKTLQNVAWSAEILDVRTRCRYVEDRPIKAVVEVDFAVGRGPAATSHDHELQYFVAVTRKNRALIAKQEFAVPVRVKGDIATVRFTEDMNTITIPRLDRSISGSNFEIAVGLVVTQDQLIFNRSGQSLKFPNL